MKPILFFLISIIFLGCGESSEVNETKIHELESRNNELEKQVRVLDSILNSVMFRQADVIFSSNVEVTNSKILELGDTLKAMVRLVQPEQINPIKIHIEVLEGLYQKKVSDITYEILYVPKTRGKLNYKGVLKVEVREGIKHYPFEIEAQVQ